MDYKFSNLTISNITRINNFNLNHLNNIIYLNNTIHTDNNNNFSLDINHSNSTFIINNINQPIYKKNITQIQKKNSLQLFHSNNHNLQINDIIILHNITYNSINLLNDILQNKYIFYKVIDTTRNTFRLQTYNNYDNSINNITNIFKTSSNLTDSYFSLYSTKTYKNISSIDSINKITVINHSFSIGDIVQFDNFNYLNTQYSNSQFKITLIEQNMITLVDTLNNNTDLFTQHPVNFTNNNIYIKLIHSTNLNKNFTITLPNINTISNPGALFNFIINTPLNSFSISTSTNDILSGTIKFSSNHLITSDLIFSTDNSNNLSLSNINLLNSTINIISLENNKWYIDINIKDNLIKYNISFINQFLYFNNIIPQNILFYINFIYEFDLSDSSLIDNHFILVDSNNNPILKNITLFGKIGTPNCKLKIYIDNTFTVNTNISIKYKKNTNTSAFNYFVLGTIREFSNPFSII